MNARSSTAAAPATPEPTLSSAWQIGLSIAIALHITATLIPPLAFATRSASGPMSPAVEPVSQLFRPYIDALYLDHAYFFFAPNPGPSHLVRYEVNFNDKREAVSGQFPDLKKQWPRLLYHRHFMLAESLNARFTPPVDPIAAPRREDFPPRQARGYDRARERWEQSHELWKQSRERYVALKTSVEKHLQHQFQGDEAHVVRREHRQLTPDEFLLFHVNMDDNETYRDLAEVSDMEALPWNANRTP